MNSVHARTDLLHLGEVVGGVAVEHHAAHLAEGELLREGGNWWGVFDSLNA